MGPWDSYAPEDPRGQPANWTPNEAGEYRYVGPVDPAWGTVNQANSYVAPGVGGGVPVDPAYSSSANPAYTGGPYTSPNSEYVPYQPSPSVSEQVATSQQPAPTGYGGYDPLASAYPPAPTPAPLQSISTIGDVPASAPVSGTYGYGSGQSDFLTPQYPVIEGMYQDYLNQSASGALPTTTQPLPAGGGNTMAPTGGSAAPLYTENAPSTGATTGMNAYGDAFSGDAFSGGGGGGGGGGYSSTYPYPSIPGGGSGGATPPDRQFDPRAFDPFAWSGVGNPMPASNPTRNAVLGNQGLSGPAWFPAGPPPPTPAEQKKVLLNAIKVGQEISDAQHEADMAQQGQRPMSGMEYVRNRLKLNPP